MSPNPDPIDLLVARRPSTAVLDTEWSPAERAELRASILDDVPRAERLHFAPRRRNWAVLAPVLGGVAVVAMIAGIVVVAARSGDNSAPQPLGPPFVASSVRMTPDVGTGQYAYRVDLTYTQAAGKAPVYTGPDASHNETWMAPNGQSWVYSVDGKGSVQCYRFDHTGTSEFSNPTKPFIDALPTDPTSLLTYMRSHVQGSTSRDEAVFVAVGDMLRVADGLASSQLRAALVSVLSRTARVTVHPDVRDVRGRAAVRADFVDAKNRPGELPSLFFDASTFQLLDDREGRTAGPTPPYASTSYEASGAPGNSPLTLTGAATGDVMTAESVVDNLPAKVQGCPDGGN